LAELADEVPATALAVYAHPNDADVGCGGTLARWSKAGCEVHLLVCTDGAKGSPDPDLDGRTLATRRAEELAAAADVVGLASHRCLGLADGEVENSDGLRAELVGAVRSLRPDVVLGHDPTSVFFGQHYFNHHDHRQAGWALLDALFPAAALPHYYPDRGRAHQVPLVYLSGTLEPAVWVDITETIDLKLAAVACHGSQLPETGSWAAEALRSAAAEEGERAGVPFAEGFRRLYVGA
jgi:LmbE family N-acetylglucosaminyl deacetylase